MSLSILVIAIPGILTTTIFLLIYYILVIRCCLNRRSSGLLLPLFSTPGSHTSPPSAAAEPTGLDAAAISSIPTFRYSSSVPFSAGAECPVCLSDFRSGERLRLLPNCAHAFHIDCIDAWLQSKTSCPLCRSRVTGPFPFPADRIISPIQSVGFEVGGEGGWSQRRRSGPAESMGDELIEARREKDEFFAVHPLRRSLSLDSSSDLQLSVSVQENNSWNSDFVHGEVSNDGGGGGGGGGDGGGSGRARRSFFAFGPGRNSRSAVRPVDIR